MTTITITITETQQSALEYVAVDTQEWANNAIHTRADSAIHEIVTLYTTRALDEGVSIPATRELIVADAYTRGWVVALADVADPVTPEE
jgi:hypothetical protein